jgi:hypothetical protein
MARIVLEHPKTGLRLAVEEEDFDNPDANPANHARPNYTVDLVGAQPTTVTHENGRDGDDRLSLKAEGYEPVAYQDADSSERPLPKNYKAPGGTR